MNKRGQFFLLAAVIISAVIISLGVGTNKVTYTEEPDDFYDFGQEIESESAAVLDYKVFNNIDEDADLEEFVGLLARDIQDRSPDLEFVFIYGNKSGVVVENYGVADLAVNDLEVWDSDSSTICIDGYCSEVDSGNSGSYNIDLEDSRTVTGSVGASDDYGSVSIIVDGSEFKFLFSDSRQVVFIMKKEEGDNTYFLVK